MINEEKNWFGVFRNNYIDNYIRLVIQSYNCIQTSSRKQIKKEEERRTELVDFMRQLKNEYHITFPITYESGINSKRMDICCYLDGLTENFYICFECKRFLKTTTTKSNFYSEYYGEGIKRFENNEYSAHMSQAGMIAFLESGDFDKLQKLMNKELPSNAVAMSVKDCSSEYGYNFVLKSAHNRVAKNGNISLHHILMDLT